MVQTNDYDDVALARRVVLVGSTPVVSENLATVGGANIALGAAASAASIPSVTATDDVMVGSRTETAPASDTASSGLNGRLQRIAQRLSSLIALFTATANSDTNRLPVSVLDGVSLGPFSQSAAAVLFTQDMAGYSGISVQVTSAGTSCTINYETSDDNATWVTAPGMNCASIVGSASGNSTVAQLARFPKFGRYFRARVSTYTSGTVTVYATLHNAAAPMVAVQGAIIVAGTAASGAAVLGGPVRIGAQARTTNLSATTGQAVDGVATLAGAIINKQFSIPELDWKYAAAASGMLDTTTAVTCVAAAGAGVRNYLTSFQLMWEALTNATEFVIRDGASGTVIWRTKIPSGAAGREEHTFNTPIGGTANTLMEFVTLTASGAGAVYFNAQGYQAP